MRSLSSRLPRSEQYRQLLLAVVIMVFVLAIAGWLAARLLRAAPPPTISQGQTVAQAIAQAAAQSEGVTLASGAYVPGSGMVLYSRREQGDATTIRAWVLMQLEPFRERLATLPAGETLTWVIDYGSAPIQQEVIEAPLPRANDQSRHRFTSRVLHENGQEADQGQALARSIAQGAAQDNDVASATGTYVPGRGMVQYSRRESGNAASIRTWVLTQLEPYRDRLAALPADETLTWVIDYGSVPVQQEVIEAPLARAMERTLHRYVSLTQPEAQPGVVVEAPGSGAAGTSGTAVPEEAMTPVPMAELVETPPPADSQAGTPANETLVSTFDDGAPGWGYLSGQWIAADGAYKQTDSTGFDYMTMANTAPVSEYTLETRLRTIDGNLGGGFVYNAPDLINRANAMMVDLTEQGSAMRWGYYNDRGDYVFIASAPVSPPVADGNWHTLRLETRGAESTIYLNDKEIGVIPNQSTSGHVGLVTTKAAVEFDDVSLLPLEAID